MFNLFRKKKLPLLDPALYPIMSVNFQSTLWQNHPYFLQLTWANSQNQLSLLSSFYEEQVFFATEHEPAQTVKLQLIGRNDQKLKDQYLLYLQLSFHQILQDLKDRAEKLKQDQGQASELILGQTEEQNYQWLEATLKVLKNAIESKIQQDDYLLQYHIEYNAQSAECFLKLKTYNLLFEFSQKDHQIHLMVIDLKDGQKETIADRYDLVFFEQFPKVIDLMTSYFQFIGDNTRLDTIPKNAN